MVEANFNFSTITNGDNKSPFTSMNFACCSVFFGIVDIINVGTGTSASFQSIANIIIKKLQKGKIEYIKFPNKFKGKYQSFTKANIFKLRKLGYKKKLTNIDKGISLYLNKLNNV